MFGKIDMELVVQAMLGVVVLMSFFLIYEVSRRLAYGFARAGILEAKGSVSNMILGFVVALNIIFSVVSLVVALILIYSVFSILTWPLAANLMLTVVVSMLAMSAGGLYGRYLSLA